MVWKMTWGILQIFSRALKIGILMGSFNANLKKYELKIHREGICYGNEKLRKIWRGTDLSFQGWHEEFDEFFPEHLKVSKIFILMDSFWANYKLYIAWTKKSTEELSFIKLERDAKFAEESTCHFKIRITNLTSLTWALESLKKFSL